jgi:hypothetical protein
MKVAVQPLVTKARTKRQKEEARADKEIRIGGSDAE